MHRLPHTLNKHDVVLEIDFANMVALIGETEPMGVSSGPTGTDNRERHIMRHYRLRYLDAHLKARAEQLVCERARGRVTKPAIDAEDYLWNAKAQGQAGKINYRWHYQNVYRADLTR